MSLPRDGLHPVPVETARVAHAAFPDSSVYLRLRDELGTLFDDELFTAVYSVEGQPALHPWQLALVSVLQFMENLSDRQAAQAVRARIDWKYALGLELTDEGFHYSVLSEFRSRLVQGSLEQTLLDRLLTRCQERGWLKARGRQRTDSTHVLGAVKALNQLELVGETLRHALNVLATVAPEWLRPQIPPDWFARYAERIEDYRLPKDKAKRDALSATMGEDGYGLLATIHQAAMQQEWAWLKELPAVRILEQTWAQQYRQADGHAQRLTPQEMPSVSEWYRSPYDQEVRYGRKRDFAWIGYKVHLTECCDDDLPHLITQVETTPATQQDHHALKAIQAQLADKQLTPNEHLVDAGYLSAKRIVESRDQYAIDLVGPVHVDPSWQARTPDALDVSQFQVDWERKEVTCPQGEQSISWHLGKDAKGESVVQVWFAQPTCRACPLRQRCTTAQVTGRSMTLRFPLERHAMLQAARTHQQTPEFHEVYRARCGIEGTFSQTTRNTGLRRARYIGQRKTHLQHLFTALATNILRLVCWLDGTPFAKTRTSRLAALAA
jgi:transposase